MCLECRRSWNSCRWLERAIFTTNGDSGHLEATNYIIGNIAEHFGASTVILLGDTNNTVRFREDAKLNKYRALFTQPRPFRETQHMGFSASFGEISWLFREKFLDFGICRSHRQYILQSGRPNSTCQRQLSTAKQTLRFKWK